ncbi:TPA: DUF3440 domain-containing protein [Enterococcus faecalis]|nr:DUF3440 domain-containing protein [Enterococcus faecalis]EGO6561347.1 DUF3440 domain-containing protein [Enterococcus faecalis]EGO7560948.1 DUF3440 domain-containing protein [Enterococcus faecalis]EGO7742720.1 DUF3440 domain-containing protein [Enterococcus faecalis]EGO8387405.1 DUF3440 domain-containing protein [Enterococcus faecalis]
MNVLDATKQRLTYIFSEFSHVYFSLSGGKDSGVMVQLANQVALEMNRTFDLYILDVEANYVSTLDFIERMKQLPAVKDVYHFCLPFFEDNNTSIFQPQWLMWNPAEKEKWVHPMPNGVIHEGNLPTSLVKAVSKSHGNPDHFSHHFLAWYSDQHQGESVACGVGIRAEESLNRFNAIAKGHRKYEGKSWINQATEENYNFYPLYDWKVMDIWGAVAQLDLDYNTFYEKLFKLGVPLSQMRICQPYGLQQRKGLKQFALVEPETWEKVMNRVSGANFGSLYARTALLGHFQSKKPEYMSWQEYAVFLLETIGLSSSGLRNHYYRKIKILMTYYQLNFAMTVADMSDESSPKQWHYDERLWHNWKGIARAVEKNDFAFTTRGYSLTKEDEKELYALYFQFQEATGIDALQGKMYQKIKDKLKQAE